MDTKSKRAEDNLGKIDDTANLDQESGRNGEVSRNTKGKSCKGYLFYSSSLKSKGSNPRCIGIPRTFAQVPNYVVSQSEAEASREGRALLDFYYACGGYSIYSISDNPSEIKASKTDLPVCVGLELLVDRKPSDAETPPAVPSHKHPPEVAMDPHTRSPHNLPSNSTGDGFISRFTRNANIVASGVTKNMHRVGTRIKSTVDEFLLPFRKRPK